MKKSAIPIAVKCFMPNFDKWANNCILPKSEVLDELERLLGMWIERPIDSSINPKNSNNYIRTIITLIKDRGSALDVFMTIDLHTKGEQLLGERDSDVNAHGVIKWDEREDYHVTKAYVNDLIAQEIYCFSGNKAPKNPTGGMTYFDTSLNCTVIYDSNQWIKTNT